MEESVKNEYGESSLNVVLALPVPTSAEKAKLNSERSAGRVKRSPKETEPASERSAGRGKRSPKETEPASGSNPRGLDSDNIFINNGEDVVERILSYFDKTLPSSRGCLGAILSATGYIVNPTICTGMLTTSYEGCFSLIRLQGTCIVPKVGKAELSQGLTIKLSGSGGHAFGGHVEGSLIAASRVQVCVCSFSHEHGADDDSFE